MGPEITKPIHPPHPQPRFCCVENFLPAVKAEPLYPVRMVPAQVPCQHQASDVLALGCLAARDPGWRVKFLPVIAEVDGFLLPSREGLILTIHLQSRGWGSGARYENLPLSPTPPPIPPASGWCYLRESSPHPLLARSVVRLGGGSEGGCNCERKCLGCTCLWLSFVFK